MSVRNEYSTECEECLCYNSIHKCEECWRKIIINEVIETINEFGEKGKFFNTEQAIKILDKLRQMIQDKHGKI